MAQLMADNTNWNSRPFIKEISLTNGQYSAFCVEKNTNLPLRVTICWNDPPGPYQYPYMPNYQPDPTNLVLVHDMDLRIIDPSGCTNFPWILSLNSPTDAAEYGDNIRDNVEQVVVTNNLPGEYAVLITHKGVLTTNQCVSVLISGCIPKNIEQRMDISTSTNGHPTVTWNSAVGNTEVLMGSTDLTDSNAWIEIPGSERSIIHEENEWVDESGGSNQYRFYRVKQIE